MKTKQEEIKLEDYLALQILSSHKFMTDLTEGLKKEEFNNYEIGVKLAEESKRLSKHIAKEINKKEFKK